MSISHGMNVGDVRVLGELLQSRGERLFALAAEVDRLVYSIDWGGGDATSFGKDWPVHRARLIACADRLRGLGQSAFNNASEQEQASAATSSPHLAHSTAGQGWSALGSWGRSRFEDANTGWDSGSLLSEDLLGKKLPSGMQRFGAGMFVVGTALHGVDYVRALKDGDTGGTLAATGRLVLDGASVISPHARAFNVGVGIGEFITDHTELDEQIADNVVAATVYRNHGTTELTSAQAADLTQRYSGVSGFGNYLADSGRTALENITGLFR